MPDRPPPDKATTIMARYLAEPPTGRDEIVPRVAQELAISDEDADDICRATAETTLTIVEDAGDARTAATISLMCLMQGLALARLAREYEEEHA